LDLDEHKEYLIRILAVFN